MKKHLENLKQNAERMKKPVLVMVFLLILDWLLFVIIFSLNNVFRPDILAISVYLSLYVYLFLTKRRHDIPYLLISSVMALIWIMFANDQYGYNREMLHIFGLNAFPIFAWSTGLAAAYLIYTDFKEILSGNETRPWLWSFAIFSSLYIVLIVTLETIAYHVFNIKNLAAAMYPGLPVCNCIHAPLWMQIAYFLIGPLYFLICTYYNQKRNSWI